MIWRLRVLSPPAHPQHNNNVCEHTSIGHLKKFKITATEKSNLIIEIQKKKSKNSNELIIKWLSAMEFFLLLKVL